MRVLVKEGDAVLADLTFEDEEVDVGSDVGCAIHLPDMRVSPRNARLLPTDKGRWRIENLDPGNRILVNNHGLMEPTGLADGDEIRLHDYVLKIYLAATLDHHVSEEPQLPAEELARIRRFPLPAGTIVKRHFDGITMVRAQLDQASNLGVEVSHCRDIHELVENTIQLLLGVFEARAVWIGIRLEAHGELSVEGGRFRSGQPTGRNPIIELLEYRCCEREQHICIRKVRDQPDIGSAMAIPLSTRRGTFGMVYVDRRPGQRRFQIPDLDLLTAFGSTVASKLGVLLEGRLARSAVISAAEVNVAHTLQSLLDPRHAPSLGRIQIAAYSRSGQERPGDVYDIMRRPDSSITAFLMGHVRATGSSLALSMARLHSTFRVAMLHNDTPHAFLRQLNWMLHEEKDPALVDAFCLLLDSATGKTQHSRAGRIGAFVLDPRGQPRKLKAADGPSVGTTRDHKYLSATDELAPGETLAIYTGGVANATDAAGERFGEARFIQLVCDGFGETPGVIMQEVTHELIEFFRDGRHPEDITILMLQHTAR